MEWIFASVVLWLAVVHEGFREVLMWIIGLSVAACVLIAIFAH